MDALKIPQSPIHRLDPGSQKEPLSPHLRYRALHLQEPDVGHWGAQLRPLDRRGRIQRRRGGVQRLTDRFHALREQASVLIAFRLLPILMSPNAFESGAAASRDDGCNGGLIPGVRVNPC